MRPRVPVLPILAVLAGLSPSLPAQAHDEATGVVFHDRNRNQAREDREEGLPDVRVSNGVDIVATDAEGRWRLPVRGEECIFFVLKPRGYMTPVDRHNLPRFFRIHKPAGSPKLRYGGVRPTGPLPASIDFPLHAEAEPPRFRVVVFGDTQPRDVKEVEDIAHDVVEELMGVDAVFGITLGDIVFDDLSVTPHLTGAISLLGLPWYNVLGNHDMNYDAPDDVHSDETFERHFGPSWYAFDRGPVHFIVLDDVCWYGKTETRKGHYEGRIGSDQLAFVRNDLAFVPKERLVVLLMHIPLDEVADREDLFRILEDRPRALSVSAHEHYQEHRFFGAAQGWRGAEPHHHIVHATVCGSWWSGAPDETGIPHAMMSDGGPNGWSIFTFENDRVSIEFRPARRPPEYQMEIHLPEEVVAGEEVATEVLVNVFAGSERSTVEMRVDGVGPWTALPRTPAEDPALLRLKLAESQPVPPAGRKLPKPVTTPHMWSGRLPSGLSRGWHRLVVRTTDMFGETHERSRIFRVRAAPRPDPESNGR